ncbi:MAG TPA: hypothetical protein VLA59_08630 [Patescibacteria group bacterium]|nr:hypothetical protein [Patescibacteria group bacterium]
MSGFGFEAFAPVESVAVEIYTSAYRITGTIHTPFRRVAEILNQLPSAHVTIEEASIAEHAATASTTTAGTAHVAVDEILVMVAPGIAGQPRAEMRIQKAPATAVLLMPPLRLAGTVHVPVGSRAIDGFINVGERFVPMTDVHLTSAAYPELDREVPILAVRRDRAQVMVITDGSTAPEPEEPGRIDSDGG